MNVRVARAGALSTLQDLGRIGYQRYGVVVGGTMDEQSHRAANLLAGNAEHEATLEITLIGPRLVFDEHALIALCGADLSPRIDDRGVPHDRPVLLRAGAQLEFGHRRSGCRAYLAIHGGYDVPAIMESKSTYLAGGFGGYGGRALRSDDVIAIGPGNAARHYPSLERAQRERNLPFVSPSLPLFERLPVAATPTQVVRVVPGRQWDRFGAEAQERFLASPFTITPNSNRMGYRLQGAKLEPRERIELISEAVSFGAVQVPPDGQPIVLMADCQTTGGYSKIAHVARVDLPVLAQMMPGQTIYFEMISLDEAQRAYVEREREFGELRRAVSGFRKER